MRTKKSNDPRIHYDNLFPFTPEIEWNQNDGGRHEAGYKGEAGDCACRAIAIATGLPYQQAYDLIIEYGKKERITKNKKHKSHPRTGVYTQCMRKLMKDLGWTWIPTMKIGSGCKVHVKADELPSGKIIVVASKHYIAIIDGVIQDTYDSSRNGTRCVYGYWQKQKDKERKC